MAETRARRKLILARLQQQGDLHVEDLARELGVSPNTIRNDFDALAATGQLKRVRGGAAVPAQPSAAPNGFQSSAFASRHGQNAEAKDRIARWAAELVSDGDSILLDASTTVYSLVSHLQHRRDLTVITNGIEAARVLARNHSNTVILLGGLLRADGMLVSTLVSDQFLQGMHIGKAFVSCTGYEPDTGLTETNIQEAQLKREMIGAASSVIALVDSSKFGNVGLVPFAPAACLQCIYTDDDLAPEWIARMSGLTERTPLIVCSSTRATRVAPSVEAARRYKIGFANLTERMPFARDVRSGLERAAAAAPNVDLLIRDNDLDPRRAIDNVNWFIDQNVDLVIEYQIDFAAGNIIMDRFRQANIPVIAVDIPLPGATYFGADNYRAGYLAGHGLGQWIATHWQGAFDYLLLLQDPRADLTTAARLQGARDGLSSVLGLVDDSSVLQFNCHSLMRETRALIRQHLPTLPQAGRIAVIGVNDDIAVGALGAFEEAGWLDRVAVVGQNADPLGLAALQRPDLPFVGSTSYESEKYGERLIDLALKMMRGEPVPPATYAGHTFVTNGLRLPTARAVLHDAAVSMLPEPSHLSS